jgi:hypothetical protein
MRLLAISLVLSLSACLAQSDQSNAEAVLKQMERAEQAGDFNTLLTLFTRQKATELEGLRKYVTARPEAHYRLIKSYVQGDRGVLFVERAGGSYVTLTLQKEGGQWKIQDQVFRDTAPNPNSVYALLPPDPGTFARSGSPWDQLPPALDAKEAARQGWQLKAVFDEAYLYIRLQTNSNLPAPGSTISTPPGGWPVLKITTSDAGEFVLYDAVNVGDQATFDSQGKANSHRAFAAYMIRLEQNHHEVFSATAGLDPSPLLAVSGRDYDIRIPLIALGIADSRATRITIGDAQWPKSAIVSIAAQRYPR